MLGSLIFFFAITIAIGVVLFVEFRQAASRDERPERYALSWAAVLAFAFVPISLTWGFALDDPYLPTARPVSPTSSSGCSGDHDNEAGILLTVLAVYLLLRLGPAVAAYLQSRRRRSSFTVLSGRVSLLVMGVILSGVVLVAVVRTFMGGSAAGAIDTYGSVTPPGARGWRARLVIRRLHTGSLQPIATGDQPEKFARHKPGSHMLGSGPYWARPNGAKIYVAGVPHVLVRHDQTLRLHPITDSLEAVFPPQRRPHFEKPPLIAPRSDGWLLAESRADGTWYAVLVDERGRQMAAKRSQAGPLLAPPLWVLLIALLLAAGAGAWLWHERKRSEGRAALARWITSWLCAELAILLYVVYWPYL